MQREQDEKEAQVRNLRLQKEARKREENLKERDKLHESQIKELRALQESHMDELKRREKENSHLQTEEEELRRIIDEMQNELADLQARPVQDPANSQIPNNLNRIKMRIRQRFEGVRRMMKEDVEVLKRIFNYCKDDSIGHLIDRFEMEYDCEIKNQLQIEAMYESEAKHNLEKWEEVWTRQTEQRQTQIHNLLQKQIKIFKDKLAENLKHQKKLIEVQEAHLAAIETTNEKFKGLLNEQEHCKKQLDTIKVDGAEGGGYEKYANDEVLRSFAGCEIREDSPQPPKYGKKKVAWT